MHVELTKKTCSISWSPYSTASRWTRALAALARAPAPPAPRRAGHGHGGVTAVRRARGARRRCGGVLSARRASVACTVRTRTRRAARAPRPARGATAPVGAQWPRAGPAARERHMQRPHTHTHTHTHLSRSSGDVSGRGTTPYTGSGTTQLQPYTGLTGRLRGVFTLIL